MTCNLLTPKDPAEKVVLTFDFTPALNASETISAIDSISVEVTAGADENAEAILDGTALATPDGKMVQQPVAAGLDNVNYSIKVVCDTSEGKRLAVTATLPVRTQ